MKVYVLAICVLLASLRAQAQAPTKNLTRSSAQDAGIFVARIATLASRLASRNIVVSHLNCDWGSFGSWQIQVEEGAAQDRHMRELIDAKDKLRTTRPESIRATWDGRDQVLTIDQSPTRPLTEPYIWKRAVDKEFTNQDDAVAFLEQYLTERFR